VKNTESLNPKFQGLVKDFLKKLDDAKIMYSVLETLRTQSTQDAYYSQGRDSLETTNAKRKEAGLYAITENENKRIITKTKSSKHIFGMAIDIVPIINKKIPWSVDTKEKADAWKKLGEIGESCGLEWGGKWTPLDSFGLGWDLPHFQWKE